jgi:hypothetical protein
MSYVFRNTVEPRRDAQEPPRDRRARPRSVIWAALILAATTMIVVLLGATGATTIGSGPGTIVSGP